MEYRIYKQYGGEPVEYFCGGITWTKRPELAREYTFHGARSVKGKLERRFVLEVKHPDICGITVVNGGSKNDYL